MKSREAVKRTGGAQDAVTVMFSVLHNLQGVPGDPGAPGRDGLKGEKVRCLLKRSGSGAAWGESCNRRHISAWAKVLQTMCVSKAGMMDHST